MHEYSGLDVQHPHIVYPTVPLNFSRLAGVTVTEHA